MTHRPPPAHSLRPLLPTTLTLVLAAGSLVGCSGGGGGSLLLPKSGPRVQLTPADFRVDVSAVAAVSEDLRPARPAILLPAPRPAPPPVAATAQAPAAPRVVDAAAARGGLSDVVAYAGPPTQTPPEPTTPQPASSTPAPTASAQASPPRPAPATPTRVVVDELVGQINGEPLYASEFFAPMDARLRQQAAQLSPRDWTRIVAQDVITGLRDRMRDKLLLAEFQSSLTPEARQGLLAFMEGLREDVLSENRGSEGIAAERIEAEQGKSLDQFVQDKADRQLIIEQIRRSVLSKVYVSRRDVVRYYEQNPDKFGAESRATFRVIQVPLGDTARIEAVEKGLAASVPFAELAKAESDFKASEGGLFEQKLASGGLAASKLFGIDALNAVATAMTPGQTSDRIDHDKDAWWLHLEKIDTKAGRTLYDAQLEIENLIRGERMNEQERKYFAQLVERASVSDQAVMVERLVNFAKNRYLGQDVVIPPDPAKPAPAAPVPAPAAVPPVPNG